MGRAVGLLVAAALLPLLAGCSGPPVQAPPPSILARGIDDLQAGAFYAFGHRGGELVFSVPSNGSADIVLYGADDERVGHVGLGASRTSGRFVLDGLAPGELVLEVLSINGTLGVRSGGDVVAGFRDLPRHVERHVLVTRPSSSPFSLLVPNRLDETLNVSLLRAPSALRVLVQGSFQRLAVTVSGAEGVVHDVEASGNPAPIAGFDGVVPGTTYPENIRDGELAIRATADDFAGTLVLEADSFSRAQAADGGAHPTREVPRFTYGALPDQPVSFEVRAGTKALYLWQEEPADACSAAQRASGSCGPPTVALFGPRDEPVAVVPVPANGTLAVPVTVAGTWVAVLLHGPATLGADVVPGDFELHPLDTVEAMTPSSAAGGNDGTYGEKREPLKVQGVPFHVRVVEQYPGNAPFTTPSFGVTGCGETTASVLSDGETIAAWGYADIDKPTWDPDLYLGDGSLEAVHSDRGSGCERLAVVVTGYQR